MIWYYIPSFRRWEDHLQQWDYKGVRFLNTWKFAIVPETPALGHLSDVFNRGLFNKLSTGAKLGPKCANHVIKINSRHDIKNNAWVTVNNDCWSRVRWFANDFHEWRSHEWKSLTNHLTNDHKIVIHGNECIILFLPRYLCLEHTIPL